MTLDVRTMFVVVAITCLIVAAVLSIVHAGRLRQRDGMLWWALGWAFQGASWTFIGLHGIAGNFFSIVVGNSLLTASYSTIYAAVRQFEGRAHSRALLLLPTVATFVFFSYFSLYTDNLVLRVVFISALCVVQTGAIVWVLFHGAPVSGRRSYFLTGFAFVVIWLIWLNRLMEGFLLPYSQLSVLEPTILGNASIMAGFAVVVVSNMGFMLMIRGKAEEMLRLSEERFRSLFETSPDAVLLTDQTTCQILGVNPAACRLYGYSPDEFLALKITDLSAEPEKTETTVRQSVLHVPVRLHRKKDGTIFPVEISGGYFAEGSLRLHTVFIRDITERMRTEEAVRASEEKFRAAFMTGLDGIYIARLEDGRAVEVNDEFEKIFGYTREELVDRTPLELNLYVDSAARARVVSELKAHGRIKDFEVKGRKKSGQTMTCSLSASAIQVGDKPHLLGVIRDITERKRAEEEVRRSRDDLERRVAERTKALAASEEKYRTLFEGSRDALFIAGPDGSIREVNNSFRMLLGYPEGSDVTGMRIQSFCADPRQRERLQQEIAKTGGVTDYALKLRRNDGSSVECFMSVNTKYSNGAVGYEGSIRDISERQMLQREVMSISAAEQARIGQDLHDNLGQLLTGIALKSKSLANYLERNSLQGAEDATRVVDLANQAAAQAGNLARNLLSADIDHGGICAWLEDLSLRVAHLYGVSCTFAYFPENIEMDRVVAHEFYRIAHEASMNAIKHGKASSVSISLHRRDHVTTLRIEDNGAGFSHAKRTDGIGLRLMNYRAQSIGASLHIHDTRQGGTIVECVLADE
jgi:PAS domain S-box-containing protein